jgi:hypothetical protein
MRSSLELVDDIGDGSDELLLALAIAKVTDGTLTSMTARDPGLPPAKDDVSSVTTRWPMTFCFMNGLS